MTPPLTEAKSRRVYNPDCWILVEVPFPDGAEIKVLAGWSGGYLDSDHWRLNSGVTRVTKDGDYFLAEGNSESIYRLHKEAEGIRLPIAHRLDELESIYGAKRINMEDYLKPKGV